MVKYIQCRVSNIFTSLTEVGMKKSDRLFVWFGWLAVAVSFFLLMRAVFCLSSSKMDIYSIETRIMVEESAGMYMLSALVVAVLAIIMIGLRKYIWRAVMSVCVEKRWKRMFRSSHA